jgi:cellulose synthase/poly-beta-1,6-N-acetylglucosamine synthase-like glycosyltransferase/peptidoglycan/xylan/chitin deacetylase (PgdA/CDA1 family)/spore germination protein YaaH
VHHAYPVFYDPSRIRAGLLKLVLAAIAGIIMAWIGVIAWGQFSSKELPSVALAAPISAIVPHSSANAAVAAPAGCELLLPPSQAYTGRQTASHPLSFAFLINWDPAGLSSLKRNMANIDILVPQWLYYSLDNRMLIEDDPGCRQDVVEMVEAHKGRGAATQIMPMVTNLFQGKGQWQGEHFADMLRAAKDRSYMADQLVDYARTRDFLGISVDFEQLPDASLPDYYAFIEELAQKLHQDNRRLSVNVPFEARPYDYARLAKAADYIIVMAYDEHWSSGEAGPIASTPWLARRVESLKSAVPAGKLVLALGNYALDWSPGKPAAVDTVEGALGKAEQAGARVMSDPVSLNPSFRYVTTDGVQHQVWFLDAVTAFNAAVTFAPAKPAGYALWRLGMEDPCIWEFLGQNRPLDAQTASRLSRVGPQQVLYRGHGEVLRVANRPSEGSRRLWRDPDTGLVKVEEFDRLPISQAMNRYGGGGKKVALTFDDGPSKGYTAQLLEVLRDNKVKGTFFVVGNMVHDLPELLRRVDAEGHDIGIHTYTHPDISKITPAQLAWELDASQQAMIDAIGRRSVLFRPPFGRDMNPSSAEQLQPICQVTDLGYLTVGFGVDTDDWMQPGVDKIVENAIDQVDAGGQIVLMHDGGGARGDTLEALPQIIRILRRRGYEFVTVSQLLGLSRDQAMPAISAAEKAQARATHYAATTMDASLRFIVGIFIAGTILGFLRLIIIGIGAFVQRRRARERKLTPCPGLTVSVIVPAHNEAKVVINTVRSLLASEGAGEFDILVVDDGSTDDTYRRASDAFDGNPRVKVMTKSNGGKSSALNYGLRRTSSDIVIMLDADTIFQPDTIRRLLAHFSDPRVGAVAGNVKVGNRLNPLAKWQALEYITSQSLDRRALTLINCNSVVPGAIGAWRRELVLQVGMLNHRTLAEDTDLTISVCRLGWQIEYEDRAIAWTEAPDTIAGFVRQRFRWMFGTLQAVTRHRGALFNRKHPWLGFVGFPNILLFQFFFPLLAPFMDLVIMISLFIMGYCWWNHIQIHSMGFPLFAFYYLLFLAVDVASACLAMLLEKQEDRKLLLWVPVQRVFYRIIMYYIAVKSIFAALSGHAVGWGCIQRKATVPTKGIIPTPPRPQPTLVEAGVSSWQA